MCESRGLAGCNAKGQGGGSALARQRGLGASWRGRQCRDPRGWAAPLQPCGSRCVPAPAEGRWVLRVLLWGGGGGGRGVPGRALLGFPVPVACGPPGFSWVSLVSQPAGCCGGLTSGRLTKGPRKSVQEDGMAGRGWVSNGCPEAAAAASLKRGYSAFRRASLAAGSSIKPSGGSA